MQTFRGRRVEPVMVLDRLGLQFLEYEFVSKKRRNVACHAASELGTLKAEIRANARDCNRQTSGGVAKPVEASNVLVAGIMAVKEVMQLVKQKQWKAVTMETDDVSAFSSPTRAEATASWCIFGVVKDIKQIKTGRTSVQIQLGKKISKEHV
ncbi:hypothetical protein CDL15_Pgr016368 [Punica granatum]|uniref:Uncharacterized protein n=1 Tax=Punica granatum TaxID=22663 RepID=A0A218W6P4_PUNGR|nr:hypothetical protein CDL15_Pgr016368 [Punica granatum]